MHEISVSLQKFLYSVAESRPSFILLDLVMYILEFNLNFPLLVFIFEIYTFEVNA